MVSAFAILFWLTVGLLLYHLIGNHLLLVALARIVAQAIQRPEYLPLVSVIIAAHNEGGVIKAKLNSVLDSRYSGDFCPLFFQRPTGRAGRLGALFLRLPDGVVAQGGR